MIVLAGAMATWIAALVYFDIRYFRLPDVLTLPPAFAAISVGLIVDPMLLAGLIWPVLYVAIGVLIGGVGGGDIKLAFSLGIIAFAIGGMFAVIFSMLTASVVSALVAVATKSEGVAHGPAMLFATIGVGTISAF